jgi:hypothetical protein
VDWWDGLQLGVGIAAGGVLNWLFSRGASRDLRREAGELRHYIDVMLSFLESVESAG